MRRNKQEENDYKTVASALGISEREVKSIIGSFFGVIVSESRKLPFNDERRIYSAELFDDYSIVYNIPFIGRIGTVYSRYLKWRANEAKGSGQVDRSLFRKGFSQDEIETIAGEILSGKTLIPGKKKGSELYQRVWMVGRNGKRMARQVIPKQKQK